MSYCPSTFLRLGSSALARERGRDGAEVIDHLSACAIVITAAGPYPTYALACCNSNAQVVALPTVQFSGRGSACEDADCQSCTSMV